MENFLKSNVVVIFSVFISRITGTEVMFQYEASDDTGDQMPNQFNVTFSTETKFLTKFNLRRSQSFDVNIPLYTLDVDKKGFFQKQRVKIRPRKAIGYYHDTNHKAVFCIKRSRKTLSNNKSKFHLKAVFQMDNSEYLFDSDNKTPKKPWRNLSLETRFSSIRNESTTPRSRTTFDYNVYKLQLLRRTSFDLFDTRIPHVEKTVRWNVINQSTSWSDPPSRRRRNALRDYYVDVVALIDKLRFEWFLEKAKNDYNTARRNIREHYAMVFSGIDMLFKGINHPNYTIHIRLCKIDILEGPNAANFISKYASDGKMDAGLALEALKNFFQGVGHPIVGFYDYVILFTGYDLFKYESSGKINYAYVGNSFQKTMCRTDGTSCAVIEDRRGPDLKIIAHALGHSLSAKHDGDGNSCFKYNRYIMYSGELRMEAPETIYNSWQFSSCSVNYFTTFLTKFDSSSYRYDCLAYAIEASDDIPDVSNKLLGQIIKPNQQCQLYFGKASYYCKGAKNTQIEDICHSLYCQDPLNSGDCKVMEAYIGTSCGDGKICMYGKCVNDPYAPHDDETCLFGDVHEDHCKSLISTFVGNCYRNEHYDLCCGTCNNMYRPILGCEYGDKKENCQSYHCVKEKRTCCGTCNYGTPFTPNTRRTIPTRITSKKPLLIRNSPKVLGDCKQGDLDLRPELCHDPSVCKNYFFLCCEYCSRYFTLPTRTTIAPNDCSSGNLDFLPELCTNISICLTNRSLCCDYCSRVEYSTVSWTPEITTPKDCFPGDLDLFPELCTNITICLTNISLCCDYCLRLQNYKVTWTTKITTHKDCAPGDLDFFPELCTNISICLTYRSLCCDYCSQEENYTVTWTTKITTPKDCAPGDLDLFPALCTNINICLTYRSLCCDYCSQVENYTVTWTTEITSPKECVLGKPDLNPELCTSPSVCQTQPLMCCNYCTYNSGAIFHLYNTWIYRCFYINCIFFLSKQMSA
ncbi:uncharacterized protein LOC106078253 isoform X2 [Biomphalaria glabrata]|uniref:Uncharacterized protein LOC106078253 isoform X2 n=1 Tax=Biomphalaria glabrata TaxID=6526 RepID=A0A9W3AJR7_BIOGL|nr:uncharacterized protein LOC106078253 isoform X2 [Biomphalaria glabrata]